MIRASRPSPKPVGPRIAVVAGGACALIALAFTLRGGAAAAVDHPSVSIATSDAAASEVGPDEGTFVVTRTGTATGALQVLFSVTGDAIDGIDHQGLSGSVTIPDGEATATMTVTPIPDTLAEGDETVTVQLAADTAYDIGAPDSATLTIVDEQRQTTVLQQGSNGYSGTLDTNLEQARPDSDSAAATTLVVDGDTPSGTGLDQQGLLRFDGVFGTDPGQIPVELPIVSAQLELEVIDPGDTIVLHRMLQVWDDTATWTSMNEGLSADDVEAAASGRAVVDPRVGRLAIDVTQDLLAWQADPSSNLGWAMLPTSNNGLDFWSAEGTTPPRLTIIHDAPGNASPVAVDDGGTGFTTAGDTRFVTANVGANDIDPDGDLLTVGSIDTTSTAGTVIDLGDGTFEYTPPVGFTGTDTFGYTATDPDGETDDAVVSIGVSVRTGSVTLTAAGDHGGRNDRGGRTLNLIASIDPDAHLALGDLSYGEIAPESAWCDWVTKGDPANGVSGIGTIPFEILTGNHDDDGSDQGLIRNFAACLPDRLEAVGDYGVEYSFDLGQLVRVVMISPDLTIDGVDYDYDSGPHREWLEQTVLDARAQGIPWVVVGMHKNCVTLGEKSCEVGESLMDWLLAPGRADVVMQGHDHSVQRTHQLTCVDPGTTTAACIADRDGTHRQGDGGVTLVSGVFGRSPYSIDPADPEAGYFAAWMDPASVTNSDVFGVWRLDFTATQLTGEWSGVADVYSDAFTITADRAADPPTDPSQLSVCPASMPIGVVGQGVAARDDATGSGYLMWSRADVGTRFGVQAGQAEHLVAVVWDGSSWHADDNWTLRPFVPAADDCLVAQLDFSADTASVSPMSDAVIHGIDSSWSATTLTVTPNRWNQAVNPGEFGVSGSVILAD